MSDSIRIMCPNLKCRALLSVPGAARGKSVKCRACGTRVRIPDPVAAPARTPAPQPDVDTADEVDQSEDGAAAA